MITTNRIRAQRFGKLLRVYDTGDTDQECLVDLLADARHWCDSQELSYVEHDRRAHDHYTMEVVEERRR